jgi:hypothetical protein
LASILNKFTRKQEAISGQLHSEAMTPSFKIPESLLSMVSSKQESSAFQVFALFGAI